MAPSTTKPARQLSAPQIPKATVSGSPRSMTRSPGLRRPYRARGPAVSMRWHESGAPLHSRSRTASRSRIPGLRPQSRFRTPVEVSPAACSKAAIWSGSLMTRRPSAASMRRSVAFSTDPLGPASERRVSTRYAGASIQARSRGAFQPTTPTRAPAPMPASPRIASSGRDRSRGWLGRLSSWNSTASTGSGATRASPMHSLPARRTGRPVAPRTRIASSKRGSNPDSQARLALCSRSA